MYAQRERMNIISENISNIDTINTTEGGPYKRKIAILSSGTSEYSFSGVFARIMDKPGVRVSDVTTAKNPFKKIYDPNNPYANKDGYLDVPDINIIQEMLDMMSASRAYEANVQAFNNAKTIALKALSIGK